MNYRVFSELLPKQIMTFPLFESKYKYFLSKNCPAISVLVWTFLVTYVVFVEMFADVCCEVPNHSTTVMVQWIWWLLMMPGAYFPNVLWLSDLSVMRTTDMYISFNLSHVCNKKPIVLWSLSDYYFYYNLWHQYLQKLQTLIIKFAPAMGIDILQSTPHRSPFRVRDVFYGCSIWLIFCFGSCNYLCNILQ